MAENKVQFGLKNVHYAKLTITYSSGTYSYAWGTPVRINGGVNLSLQEKGGISTFYADNIAYFRAIASNGYSGELEIAHIPDSMYTDIWGETLHGTDKTLLEKDNDTTSSFALLFQIDGDQNDNLYVLYNCDASKPNIASGTKTDSAEPKTQTLSIDASPLQTGICMCHTTAATTTTVRNGWFSAVYTQPAS